MTPLLITSLISVLLATVALVLVVVTKDRAKQEIYKDLTSGLCLVALSAHTTHALINATTTPTILPIITLALSTIAAIVFIARAITLALKQKQK